MGRARFARTILASALVLAGVLAAGGAASASTDACSTWKVVASAEAQAGNPNNTIRLIYDQCTGKVAAQAINVTTDPFYDVHVWVYNEQTKTGADGYFETEDYTNTTSYGSPWISDNYLYQESHACFSEVDDITGFNFKICTAYTFP